MAACEHTVLSSRGHAYTTSDATQTAVVHVATRTDEAYFVNVKAVAVDTTDYSQVAGYYRVATFKNDGGTLALVGGVTSAATHESNGAWNLDLDASGTDIRVLATGELGKVIKWKIDLDVLVVGAHTPIA